jgi:hypothetical protein
LQFQELSLSLSLSSLNWLRLCGWGGVRGTCLGFRV